MTPRRFDPAELHVHPDPARAETLPAFAFTDPDVLALELDAIFAPSWQLVPEPGGDSRPLGDALAVRGARAPVSVLGRPLFLQRAWDDDALRAFPNTCTHAWHPLVAGPSRGPTLSCPQHGRKFDCDGRFVSQQGFADAPDFPRECDHLTQLPVATWRGMHFVAIRQPSRQLDALLDEVDATTSALPLARRVTHPAGGEAREVQGNWKLHAWNYMDRFHVTHVHRAPGGLADAIDLASYRTELGDRSSLQWAFARDPAHGFDPAHLPERFRQGGRRVFALWWFVFPNLALNFYPWGLSVNAWQPVPGRPDTTTFIWRHLVADESKHALRDSAWLSSQVDAEDVDALAQVRRGLRSGFAPRGRFAASEEAGPHWFHRLVSTSLAP